MIRLPLLLAFLICSVQASDVAKEKRWAEQVVDAVLDGEVVWLKAQEHEFLSIFTAAEDQSAKGMIVVHGTGIHPDWEQVVKPIRVEMSTLGWNTLSIQMPILPNEATYEEYIPLYPEVPARLQAAEDYLIAQGIRDIVIVAHSQGATMSSYYLSKHDHQIRAFAAIGMLATQTDPAVNVANSLKLIKIPLLDLYGSQDLPGVLSSSQLRQTSADHNPDYQQQVIQGADHFFVGKNAELIEALDNWLSQL